MIELMKRITCVIAIWLIACISSGVTAAGGSAQPLDNYRGGIPFPNPADPHKGWKTLANVWYRYIPHLVVDTYGSGCSIDASLNYNCQTYTAVKRQLAYNTDADAPAEPPGPNARY